MRACFRRWRRSPWSPGRFSPRPRSGWPGSPSAAGRRRARRSPPLTVIPKERRGKVLVIGFGRFGQLAVQPLLAERIDVTVIDTSVERIRNAGKFGFKVYFGDGCRLDVCARPGPTRRGSSPFAWGPKDRQRHRRSCARKFPDGQGFRPRLRPHPRHRPHGARRRLPDPRNTRNRRCCSAARRWSNCAAIRIGRAKWWIRCASSISTGSRSSRRAASAAVFALESLPSAEPAPRRLAPEPLVKPAGKSQGLTKESQEIVESGDV